MKKFCNFSLLSLLFSLTAYSQTLLPDFGVTNSTVSTIAQSGNTVYIGGSFTYVGPNNYYGCPVSASTGTPIASFPKPNGLVNVAIPDGSGGWYIAGSFNSVGGQTRNQL